ncbi:TonB-dependent receptor plug domain-containing protein [Thalassotalea aquiviva]|uniref:TonB-dependent receptor plug domain-containing protein n=1 Tax=Thalassotalea aquiviva TaxID=3242415 RepID=UPI00352B9BEC
MSHTFPLRTLALAISIAISSQSVFAEEVKETLAEDMEQIVVVGSRAAPRSVADSPVPVDVIGSDELSKSGTSDMLDMLVSAIPSFNVRAQPISDAATLIRPVNLRGLPSDSTLILLNGKRRHRASVIAFQGGGVNDGAQGSDISVIPSVALKQVEVLRDGASAQYGSDAIAGVMNFVLKDDREGGSMSVKYSEFAEGDGGTTIVDGNVGLPFTENGFANLSFQLKNADPTSRSLQRPDAAGLAAAGNPDIENPAQIWGNPEIKDDVSLFANVGLDLDEHTQAYAFGNYSERDVTGGFYYRNPHNRGNVYSIDGGDTLLVGDVGLATTGMPTCSWSNATAETPLASSNVPADVPNVLDTAEYQAMVADANCFSMNQIFQGGYTPAFGGNITDTSITGGVKGDITTGLLEGWYFDLSASVGRSESSFNLKNTLNPSLGLDTPTEFETGKYIQLEKNFNFDLVRSFDVGLADDLHFATGLEWREESFEIVSGEETSWQAGPYADQGFNIGSHGFKGFGPESQGRNDRRNWATYADVETMLTEKLMVGAALRWEDYDTFGSTSDYKITGQYKLTQSLSVRGSHSTGFRAPTVGQANVVNTQTSIVNGNLIQTFIAPPTNPLSSFYGGKELEPEESTSFAGGMVFQQGELFVTVDYYNIAVEDRIAQSSQISVNPEDYDALEARGVSNPELISAVTFYNNDFDTTTQGVDLVANYNMSLLDGDTALSLAYNWNETEVDKRNPDTTNDGKVRRLEQGMPDHRATFTIAQNWDSVSAFIRTNYFGSYYATHADDTSEWGSEMASAALTFDAEVTYYATDNLVLSVGGNNIFDQEAEELKKTLSDGSAGAYATLGGKYYESGPFDYNGAIYYVKASYSF